MISVNSILEEYCKETTSSKENTFVCRLDVRYLVQLVQRLNVLEYTVTKMSYTTDDRKECVIEVMKAVIEPYDEYGDDMYYK